MMVTHQEQSLQFVVVNVSLNKSCLISHSKPTLTYISVFLTKGSCGGWAMAIVLYNLVFSCHILIHCRWYRRDTCALDELPCHQTALYDAPLPPRLWVVRDLLLAALCYWVSQWLLTHTYAPNTGQTSRQQSLGEREEAHLQAVRE